MKKISTAILVLFVVTCFSAVGFAGRSDRPDGKGWGHHKRTFTAEQKADFVDFLTQKNALTADFLQAEVAAGRMSQEVAAAHIVIMNDRAQKIINKNSDIDTFSKEQWTAAKEAKTAYRAKVREQHSKFIQKGIESGYIDKEHGGKLLEKLEKHDEFKHGNRGYFNRECFR